MDPERNGDIESMADVVRQNPLKGVWGAPRAGSFVLAQQNDDEHLDRMPLDITGNGENDMGVSMTYNPVYTHIILWALEHRNDLAAILLKLTYPNGVIDRDTCTWVDKSSKGKFDMMKPSYDVHECDRYRAMLVYENGRRLMFLPKSHTSSPLCDEFPDGRNQKKRKRTVLPFMGGKMLTKDAAPYGVSAPSASEANRTGTLGKCIPKRAAPPQRADTLAGGASRGAVDTHTHTHTLVVIFKDVIYFEHGQLRNKDSHIFRINMGVHDASYMSEKDRLTLAMVAAARDFTPTLTGNNVTMSTVAKGLKFARFAPVFDGKRQAKYRKVDEKQRATFRQCKRNITLQRDIMHAQFEQIRPLTRHLMGDTQDEPFADAPAPIKSIWDAAL